MFMQIQKSSNVGSQFHQEFRNNLSKPPKPPSSAAKIQPAAEKGDAGDEEADQFSLEKLRSFYRMQCQEEMVKIGRKSSSQSEPPGFIFPSRRGSRLSADSAAPSSGVDPTAEEVEEIGVEDGGVVVIVTYSRSPCEDFRRSMQEMVAAARVERNGEVDREFMEELLLRYLELNNEKYYRYILRAFLELMIGVSHEDSGKAPPRRRRRWSGGFSRRKLKLEIKNMHKFCSKYRC